MAISGPSSSPQYSNSKANIVPSSGIIQKAWACISGTTQQPSSSSTTQLPFPCWEFSKSTIVVFKNATTPPAPVIDGSSSSAPLVPVERSGHFGFLLTEDNSSISLHNAALSCFNSLLPNFKEQFLPYLQKREKNQPPLRPLILAGQSLWGSVAALFTLWLLNNRHKSAPRPLCITFGSPFIGDEGLAKAICKYDLWKVGFWHVLCLYGHDFRRISTSIEQQFRPSGTYFLCPELAAFVCVSDPDLVVQLLQRCSEESAGRSHDQINIEYGGLLTRHKERAINGERDEPRSGESRPATGVVPQLVAMGIKDDHPAYASIAEALKVEHSVPQNAPSSRALYKVKKNMAQLEWYKKACEKEGDNYYDAYKRRSQEQDIDAQIPMSKLMSYWEKEVMRAEKKPHTPDFPLRDKYLFAGTNYRRLVEPLAIAKYYRKGDETSSYMTAGQRDHHFEKLEQWAGIHSARGRRDEAASLTEDSCFWARVEEARRSMNKEAEGAMDELQEFENQVMNLIGRLALSPEVFLEKSTFMKWWEEYDQKRLTPNSPFTEFMREERNRHLFYSPEAVNRYR
ncbi:senescence-associated carboxylesterase 101-like [Nymphaea colorata]|nr:senescence-associated carboxylesterase 101-like [Nymphaea colorata]